MYGYTFLIHSPRPLKDPEVDELARRLVKTAKEFLSQPQKTVAMDSGEYLGQVVTDRDHEMAKSMGVKL
jgi:hypothetical protein